MTVFRSLCQVNFRFRRLAWPSELPPRDCQGPVLSAPAIAVSDWPKMPHRTFKIFWAAALVSAFSSLFFSSHKTYSFIFTPVLVLRHGILEGKLEDRLTSCTYPLSPAACCTRGTEKFIARYMPASTTAVLPGVVRPNSEESCSAMLPWNEYTCRSVCREPRLVSPEPRKYIAQFLPFAGLEAGLPSIIRTGSP